MATFTTQGIDELALSFGQIAELPSGVLDRMVIAQGEIMSEAQSKKAATMLRGPYYAGGVANAVKLGKVKRSSDGRSVMVTFEGTQHGNRLAEIAFVNEYGKKGQAARPFIRTAIEECSDRCVDAAEKIYNDWLSQKGL